MTLFNLAVDSQTACRDFFARKQRPRLAHMPPSVPHIGIFAPTGAGKSQCILAHLLANHPGNIVIVDPKGELSRMFAKWRQTRFKHDVRVLDPYRQTNTTRPERLNVLDAVGPDDAMALDFCDELAEAIIIDDNEHQKHFPQSARLVVSCILATTLRYGDRNSSRSLQTVVDILSSPPHFAKAIELMRESNAFNGLLARRGSGLLHFKERELGSVMTTCLRAFAAFNTPAIAESTASSTFDVQDLVRRPTDIFLVMPPEHMASKSALIRLWLTAMLRTVVEAGPQQGNVTTFVIDEAATVMGARFPIIQEALSRYRSYGVRLVLAFQTPDQLKTGLNDGREGEILSNIAQIHFGVNTPEWAEAVSTRLGDETIAVESGSRSSGYSRQSSNPLVGTPQQSTSYSTNESSSWQPHGRRLLTAAEVAALPQDTAITFIAGKPPVATRLVPFYANPRLGRRPRRMTKMVAAVITLLRACLWVIGMTPFTAMIAAVLLRQHAPDTFESLKARFVNSPSRPSFSFLENRNVPERHQPVSRTRPGHQTWPRQDGRGNRPGG